MKEPVRTFRAPSPREALAQVKRELGPEAVILGTRVVPPRGLGRLTGRPWTEITAAPPDTPTAAPRAGRRPAAAGPAGSPAAAPPVPPDLYPHYVRLVQSEVAEELAARLVREAARHAPPGAGRAAALRAGLRDYIARMVPPAPSLDLESGRPRRVALVGPSGAGKTTTLAKLAARFRLGQGRQVALLSLDLQRVGAHEQLRRYAEILDVPLHTAQTIAEVKRCLRGRGTPELLLIDTPGVGLREEARFARLATLLRAARPDDVHLVLPASLAPSVLVRLAQGFAPLGPSGLVLTRLDDVVGFGVILNVIDRLKLGLAYLTTGQNVPEDIEEGCGARVAELVCPADR